jgi:23S rRNA (cytosine1962-C5)-methyltransferase
VELLTKLQAAWERRPSALRKGDLLRAFDGSGDGAHQLVVDRFGSVGLAHLFDSPEIEGTRQELRRVSPQLLELYGIAALYSWTHRRNARDSAAGGAELLAGQALKELWCVEAGIRLLIKPEANVNGGLFLDTRDIRALLARTSREARVLNTFCFTGSLGLAAWCGGAREVVQVDISKAILNWARENQVGNPERGAGEMRFIAEDSRAFMERELRRIERRNRAPFDTVVIDPPSFGSSGGITFSFKDDIGELLAVGLRLLKPGGRLFFTTNYRQMSLAELERVVRGANESARREIGSVELLRPPAADFTAALEDSYAMRGFLLQLVS